MIRPPPRPCDPSAPATRCPAPCRPCATPGFTLLNSLNRHRHQRFFLAKEAYAFDRVENYALGVLLGGTYVAGALAVGPALQRLIQRIGWITHRLALATIMLALAVVCILPWSAAGFTDSPGAGGTWAIWALVAAFDHQSRILADRRVTSARTPRPELRRAIGRNITWCRGRGVDVAHRATGRPCPAPGTPGWGRLPGRTAFLPAMGRSGTPPGRERA